jgi:hypothetical protein
MTSKSSRKIAKKPKTTTIKPDQLVSIKQLFPPKAQRGINASE